eukprot:jgi/Galph1/89/GphlegSOOS_G4882.1
MEQDSTAPSTKKRYSIYEVDGFRFRKKKKATNNFTQSSMEGDKEEFPNHEVTKQSVTVTTEPERDNHKEESSFPNETKQKDSVTTHMNSLDQQIFYFERIPKDQPEEQRFKMLCEEIWNDNYKQAVNEPLQEKGTVLRALEDLRVSFLDDVSWYFDNSENRAKTFSELSRPNPLNAELQFKIKSLEKDLNTYCNELFEWNKATAMLEEIGDLTWKKTKPSRQELTGVIKEAALSLDINLSELLEICRMVIVTKEDSAQILENIAKWINCCSFAGFPNIGNPKKLIKSVASN